MNTYVLFGVKRKAFQGDGALGKGMKLRMHTIGTERSQLG